MTASAPVTVRRHSVVLPTYEPHAPDPNPMFLEKRVYQGSSGRVYPLPFIDRIAERPHPVAWDSVELENEYLRVLILPQLGGRIHRIQDKTNGYDAVYHQPVIKPALVGLAGPWCSGGIEFNWPQHHRPSTYLPADVAIERHASGAITVWLSEHEPMARMKGMHGVRLHPGRSYVELVARVHNRTNDVQTFLWWANVATRVHEHYQSFFPTDTTHVADHAKRATTTFPHASGRYYGVDYAARQRDGVPAAEQPRQYPPRSDVRPDDLSWYANIPVPTSYMCMGSTEDFFGGYDHQARAGLVHVANHHIAPGKKQWTWGNHEFGYAWDRNLTDPDAAGESAPYIELMAGVYTDNQPDFSFLQPGETRTWSQYWYPIREIGPAQRANADAAVSLSINRGLARVGVATTAAHRQIVVTLERSGKRLRTWRRAVSPDHPLVVETPVPTGLRPSALTLRIATADRELIRFTPPAPRPSQAPAPATEPALPAQIQGNDELYLIGLHLEQYRHATRHPEAYWREALSRDPGDSRCRLALGRWHLRRGEFPDAEQHLRASVTRLTSRNPNPADGEAHYQLGRCLRAQSFAAASLDHVKLSDAYAAFYKSTWNHAWRAAAFHALAEIDCLRMDWLAACDHLQRALRLDADNLRVRNLLVIVLRRLGETAAATVRLDETSALDPLDWWSRHLAGQPLTCDNQVRFDLALDCVRAGLFADALAILDSAITTTAAGPRPDASLGTAPLVHYYRAWICHLAGDEAKARRHLARAARANPAYCFPARLEEIAILDYARRANPRDAHVPLILGHLLYDRRRHLEAIAAWESSARLQPHQSLAWRNLGIAYFNIVGDARRARSAYEKAFRAAPCDSRLLYERDQLWKRLGESPARRLRELTRHATLVALRDDLSVELGALYLQTNQPKSALEIVRHRKFQPWEGGEGQALGLYVRTHLVLGRDALHRRALSAAIEYFTAALTAPANLGEAKHLLANQSDIHFWLGEAHAATGDTAAAQAAWENAAHARGDFQAMSVQIFSEMTYYSALALDRLGRSREARRLLRDLLRHASQLARTRATIDYFATSLPTMLLFDDDLTARQTTTALLLEAQARLGLGDRRTARTRLRTVLRRDPNHPLAADLLRTA